MAKSKYEKRKLVVDTHGLSLMQQASKIVREDVNIESREDALKAMAILKQAKNDFDKLVMDSYENMKDHVKPEDLVQDGVMYDVEIPQTETVFKFEPKVSISYKKGDKAKDNEVLSNIYPDLVEEKTTIYMKSKTALEKLPDETIQAAIQSGYLRKDTTLSLKETVRSKKSKTTKTKQPKSAKPKGGKQ